MYIYILAYILTYVDVYHISQRIFAKNICSD